MTSSGWSASGNNFTHTHFVASGIANGSSMQMNKAPLYGTGANGSSCLYQIASDATNTYSFELVEISANDFNTNVDTNNVFVVGYKASGGVVESDNNSTTLGFTNFSGVQLTSFKIFFTGGCGNIDFNSFTIQNAQARLPTLLQPL